MRRSPSVLLAAIVAAVLLLAGCGGGSSSSPSPAPNEVAGSDVGFEASGEFGDRPVLTFDAATPPAGLQVAVVTEGDGAVVEAGSEVTVNYYGAVWGSDTPFDTSYDRGTASTFLLTRVIDGWSTGLAGQHVGSRVLITIPPELGYGPSGGSPSGDIGATDTIVFVVDIISAIAADASGQADATLTGAEVPVSWVGDLGMPVEGVTVDDGTAPPADIAMTVLAEGTGAPVADGDALTIQYTFTTWDNAELGSTWPALGGIGAQTVLIGAGSVFDEAVDVPVGSRVLLLLPATPENDGPALAMVADLVAVTPAS